MEKKHIDKALVIRYVLFALVAAAIVVIDQVTKLAISRTFVTGETKQIIKGFLNFTYVLNEGAAFGIMQGQKVIFVIITVLVFAAIGLYFVKFKPKHILELTAAAFIAAGAVGNLIDRLMLGYVRDFFDVAFIDFPVFNIADCSICVGAALVVIYAFIDLKESGKD